MCPILKYSGELREVEAWRDGDGGWTWNNSFHIQHVLFDEADFSPVFLIKWLVDNGFIDETKKHLVKIESLDDDTSYEVQIAATDEPIYAFIGEWVEE